MHDIVVNGSLTIPGRELVVRSTRSGGPGGQHVNTSATRVEVVWNIAQTAALDPARRDWAMARLAHRINGQGNLRIIASESRSQRQNRDAAAERLGALVARALLVPKRRRPTRPTAASKRQRIDAKRRLSEKKRLRRGAERD